MREALYGELLRQSENPPAGDMRIAAFCRCLLRLVLEENGPFAEVVLDSQKTPSHTANLALRAIQKQCMYRHDDYPYGFDNANRWAESIKEIEAHPSTLLTLIADMRRPVQSNVVERYKAFKLAAQLLAPRIGSTPRLLDVGCSRNHGLKKLRLNLPFKDVKAGFQYSSSGPDALLDSVVKCIIRQPIVLGPSVGADLIPYKQGEDAIWARSCSFYPSELLNIGGVSEYDYLDNNNFEGVEFAVADFTGYGLSPDTRQFDMITVSTFLYQLSADERARAQQHFRSLLEPQGVIVYQDFAHIAESGQDLVFNKSWFAEAFPYRTMIEFADEPLKIYEMLRWDNGRCNVWAPGKDVAQILFKQ